MIDFSDIMPMETNNIYHICPVCGSEFNFDDRKYCAMCAKLCNQDREEGRFPPRLQNYKAAFTLEVWQKYRMVERKHAKGEYTDEQMRKILRDVDEYAIEAYKEKERKRQEEKATLEAKEKPLKDLQNRKHYSY